MDDVDTGRYQRIRIQHAKRLTAEAFSRLEDGGEGHSEEQLAIIEKERIERLIAGRRQREAKLVGDFASDTIYDLEDEERLSMHQAQRESRGRIEQLCKRKKLYGSVELITNDLIQELQAYLARCPVYVGLVRPGRNSTSVLSFSNGTQITATVRRDGGSGAWYGHLPVREGVSGPAKGVESEEGERWYEGTSTQRFQQPRSDVVFKCVDTGICVVVGTTRNKQERNLSNTSFHGGSRKLEMVDKTNHPASSDLETRVSGEIYAESLHRSRENQQFGAVKVSIRRTKNERSDDRHSEFLNREEQNMSDDVLGAGVYQPSRVAPEMAVRPQLCVPLEGMGDSGCIGVIGAHGFSTNNVIGCPKWHDWWTSRVATLDRAESRSVGRLKLIRPRGIPTIGKLENVPTGTAAKVVYGSVKRIAQNRGRTMYSVRWEDGLFQFGLPTKGMCNVVAQDDASAGKNASLTADVVSHLTWIGKTVGPVLDEIRKNVHLAALQKLEDPIALHWLPAHLEPQSQITLAAEARSRDVIKSALRTLVECLPSIAAAEVWQLDSNKSIRCTQSLVAGGELCRQNKIVNSLLHEEDLEDFCKGIEHVPTMDELQLHELQVGEGETKPNNKCARCGSVTRPARTHGVLAAPFCDFTFKVGRSWIGADRLARGFALVLRVNGPNAVEEAAKPGVTPAGTPRRQGRTRAAGLDAAVHKAGERNVECGTFAARVAKEVSVALACVRGRVHREAVQALALKRLSSLCSESTTSGEEAQEAVLAEVSTVLPGCRAYIGVLQPGGEKIVYESSTTNSRMRGRELLHGEGISFACLDDPDGQVLIIRYRESATPTTSEIPRPPSLREIAAVGGPKPPPIFAGDSVEAWYASSWVAATVEQNRGHQCFDIRYNDSGESEAGVPFWRLREVVNLEHLDVKTLWNRTDKGNPREQYRKSAIDAKRNEQDTSRDSWPWPFLCVPLRNASNRVGVLGVDGWSGVNLGRPEETHPEKAVVSFLQQAGALLAAAIYTERRNRGLSAIRSALRGKGVTEDSAFEAMMGLLKEVIIYRRRVDILETRAAKPGAVYLRATWESWAHRTGISSKEATRREKSAQLFGVNAAPRVEELCVLPAYLKQVDGSEGSTYPPLNSITNQQSLVSEEITSYQREIERITCDGPVSKSGLQATVLTTRRGEIVGRFRRLAVQANGGRPSADGWYLVRVSRSLPEASRQGESKNLTYGSNMGAATASAPFALSEDGDVNLLSEMCRSMEVGFMAMATRKQRALIRAKVLGRLLTTCKRFSLGRTSPGSGTATTPASDADGHRGAFDALKDGRLARLVHQGDKRVSAVELPGGKNETLPETEVASGQSISLPSGQGSENIKRSCAALIGTGRKATSVVHQPAKATLSLTETVEGDATLAGGKEEGRAVEGLDLAEQVIASIQWALPQVDVYLGLLSPFASSLNFVAASSRSRAGGRHLCRHSTMTNGGPTFCVDRSADRDSRSILAEDAQTPSWDVIDTCKTKVVAGSFSGDSSRMHYFCDPNLQGWPWVGVPIRPGLRSRAVRGILCVDRFEEPSADKEAVVFHPEDDVRSFLEDCASALGLALDREAKNRALRRLRSFFFAGSGSATTVSPDGGGGDGQTSRCPVEGDCAVKNGGHGMISSVEDIYAAATAALSKALVHCKRFEIAEQSLMSSSAKVWEATQPSDESGNFFVETAITTRPLPFQPDDGDMKEIQRRRRGVAQREQWEDPLATQLEGDYEPSQTNRSVRRVSEGVVPRIQSRLSRDLHAHRGTKLLQDLQKPRRHDNEESNAEVQGSARKKGAMSFMECLGFSRKDGGPPVKGDLSQRPGIA